MPQSKKRHHHHQHYNTPHVIPVKKNKRVTPVTVIFFALLGIGIAFFGAGMNILWLSIGAITGGALGYFFATRLDKTFNKSK